MEKKSITWLCSFQPALGGFCVFSCVFIFSIVVVCISKRGFHIGQRFFTKTQLNLKYMFYLLLPYCFSQHVSHYFLNLKYVKRHVCIMAF